MKQEKSGIWGDEGYYVYGQQGTEDARIHTEISRKKWQRLYGE